VALFDVTASFTHWGTYNIPVTTTELARTPALPEAALARKCSMMRAVSDTAAHDIKGAPVYIE
jgi:hypothetical protein